MKQEQLKVALCGYLPWEVKMKAMNKSRRRREIELLTFKNFDILMFLKRQPILYSLNTLTKPIIVKGYNGGLPFVPIEEIGKKLLGELYRSFDFPKEDELFIGIHSKYGGWSMYNYGDYESLPYWIIDLLNRWKIDYRNLIGQGLAIDVETLNENCYE